MSRLTLAVLASQLDALRAENTELRAKIDALSTKPTSHVVAASADVVYPWNNNQQRDFWVPKAIDRLRREQPDARSFTKADVHAKAWALCSAAAERRASN